jgi:PAS domain S-box-containing protein
MNENAQKTDILLVDDRRDGLIALEAVLGAPDINIVTALSGMEALALLPRHDFAVILLDVQMPGIDGFETAARIKAQEKYRNIPIVFVTAISSEERYVFRGYESGAVDYISKPFEPYVIKSKVSVFVNLHRQARLIRHQSSRLRDIERRDRARHLAELELESLRRYRSLADAIPHIVFHANTDGAVNYFNLLWSEVTGLTPERSSGDAWQSAFHPEDIQEFLRKWLDAMRTGDRFEAECRIFCRRKQGNSDFIKVEPRWHLVLGVPEKRSEATITAWICTATDIHDRKAAEVALIRAKEFADSANAAKTQFLANMSHEIRTPLSAILGFSELMMSPEQTIPERIQAATTIRRNGEQLLDIINEILDISKVESGKLEIDMTRTDLQTLLTELRSLFELHANERGLAFKIEMEETIPRFIVTDSTRFRQILINIVGNAIKFTSAGSVGLALSKVDREDKKVELIVRVTDTGVGISTESRERLFKPFSQEDNSTSRRFGGTGLGLSLSRQLARALGGDVRIVESAPTLGSVFEVSILTHADPDDQGAVLTRGPLPVRDTISAAVRTADGTVLNTKRILLVEDAVDNQVLISRYLTFAGAAVQIANNGAEALDILKTEAFDVVLMDIQMPVMDGYTATQTLRERGYKSRIIALTAHALNSEREKCLAAGFDDHLPKPVNRQNLIDRLSL